MSPFYLSLPLILCITSENIFLARVLYFDPASSRRIVTTSTIYSHFCMDAEDLIHTPSAPPHKALSRWGWSPVRDLPGSPPGLHLFEGWPPDGDHPGNQSPAPYLGLGPARNPTPESCRSRALQFDRPPSQNVTVSLHTCLLHWLLSESALLPAHHCTL